TTPLVVDLDGDGTPEIVFHAASASAAAGCTPLGVKLHAIRGDCTDVWSVDAAFSVCAQIAAGDVTGDGKPEIVGYDHVNKVVHVIGGDGKPVADSPTLDDLNTSPGNGQATGPAIADLDGVPPAEIIIGGTVLRVEGSVAKVVFSNKI